MNGVTTAIVVFVLASLAFPALIKKQTRFYMALASVVAIIALDAFGHMSVAPALEAVVYVFVAFLQVVAIISLVQAAGGPSAREIKEEIIEVVRRGGDETEVIAPQAGIRPRPPVSSAGSRAKRDDPDQPVVYHIEDPAPGSPPPPSKGSLPLD
jgi:hypothetical protein